MDEIKLTKDQVIEALKICSSDTYKCSECPLRDKWSDGAHHIGDVSCSMFLKERAREYLLNSTTDISKIIDEAMEKKNRSVTVFVGPQGTTVNVYPYEESKPHWIKGGNDDYYICSECGASNHFAAPYCPLCGEKLSMPNVVEYVCNRCLHIGQKFGTCSECRDNSKFEEIGAPTDE